MRSARNPLRGFAQRGLVSPKNGVIVDPWKGTEFYGNAGTGFHSNDARGTTITRDAQGMPSDPVSDNPPRSLFTTT